AGPRWGVEQSVQHRRGIDLVLALDASLSMEATDAKPTRLAQMKQEVRRLRALSPGDRIGLIVFAGRAYVLSPLTVDESALDLFLDNLDPSIVGQARRAPPRGVRRRGGHQPADHGAIAQPVEARAAAPVGAHERPRREGGKQEREAEQPGVVDRHGRGAFHAARPSSRSRLAMARASGHR
ncbi:MAG: hypothetical protein B7Z72_11430, partial [Gemmatimonadetes bacterium 21-71-4]